MKNIYFIVVLLVFGIITGCKNDEINLTNTVSGKIRYDGLYSGQNRTIYVRGYIANSNAIGAPDYTISISDTGSYSLDLAGYTGDLYLSAFMDIDNSGSLDGPSANKVLIDGVYADPSGCYGDYTFENGGPIKITIDGAVTDIDFELQDNGVIKAIFSDIGHCTFGVIKTNILSEEFLHHEHCDVVSNTDTFLLGVPAKEGWYCKVKFDNLSMAQIYSNPVKVVANNISVVSF